WPGPASARCCASSTGSACEPGAAQGGRGMRRLILPMPGNEALAAALARACDGETGRVETRRFPDGESYVRLHGDPAGRPVDLVCTLARPDPGFLALVFAADAARELGAREVTLVAPYLAYMRQDIRFLPRECVSSRSFPPLLSASGDRRVTVDPHLHRPPAPWSRPTWPTCARTSASSPASASVRAASRGCCRRASTGWSPSTRTCTGTRRCRRSTPYPPRPCRLRRCWPTGSPRTWTRHWWSAPTRRAGSGPVPSRPASARRTWCCARPGSATARCASTCPICRGGATAPRCWWTTSP